MGGFRPFPGPPLVFVFSLFLCACLGTDAVWLEYIAQLMSKKKSHEKVETWSCTAVLSREDDPFITPYTLHLNLCFFKLTRFTLPVFFKSTQHIKFRFRLILSQRVLHLNLFQVSAFYVLHLNLFLSQRGLYAFTFSTSERLSLHFFLVNTICSFSFFLS